MGGFDKFTRRAKQVLSLAQEEARSFNHPHVGTEHILLGLIREGEGVAARVLEELGVKLSKARSAVEFIVGYGEGARHTGEMELTARAKKVIEYAIEEALRLGHHYVGTEHLLLGLERMTEGVAIGMLDIMSVSLPRVRSRVLAMLHAGSGTLAALPGDKGSAFDRLLSKRPISWRELGVELRLHTLPQPWQSSVAQELGMSERLLRVVAFARDEARELQQAVVDTPHLLVGLLRGAEDQGFELLERQGLTVERVREAARELASDPAHRTTSPLPAAGISWRAKEALLYAAYEAAMFFEQSMSGGHLLLGLLRLEELGDHGILRELGLDPATLRAELMRAMGGRGAARPDAEAAQDKGAERPAGAGAAPPEQTEPWPHDSAAFGPEQHGSLLARLGIGAQRAVELAQQEARRFNHAYVGTAHLLLGLISGHGRASQVLRMLGLEAAKARDALELVVGHDEVAAPAGELALSGRALVALGHAQAEAAGRGQEAVETEHLLLGLTEVQDGVATHIFDVFGLNLAHVRQHLLRAMGEPAE